MRDDRPDSENAEPTPSNSESEHVDSTPESSHEVDEHSLYYEPTEGSAPLGSKVPTPNVKRFNRKTVFTISAIVGVAAIAAFGTALTRKPPMQTGQPEASSQKAPANATATDVINALPSNYDQVPRLGPAIPGDVGEAARATGYGVNGAVPAGGPGAPRQLSQYEQYLQQAAIDDAKRRAKALESSFDLPGGAAPMASATPAVLSSNGGGDGAIPASSRDNDNRQDDKERFLSTNRGGRFHLNNEVAQQRSPYTLFSGTLIPGVLITGINSDLPGQIKGQISQNVYDTVTGNYLLLPQGTTLIGMYDSRITYGQSRVLVVWTRIIRPDGSNLDLEGMPGVDMTGYAGITGDIDRHLVRLLGAVVLGSVIQAGAQAGTNTSALGTTSAEDRALQGIGSGVNDATQQIVRKELNIQPTIRVAPGERFNVFTTKDIVIPPV